jgi:hypothetical protein
MLAHAASVLGLSVLGLKEKFGGSTKPRKNAEIAHAEPSSMLTSLVACVRRWRVARRSAV